MESWEGLRDYDFSSVASSVLHCSRDYKLRERFHSQGRVTWGEKWKKTDLDQEFVHSDEMTKEPDVKGKSSFSKDQVPRNQILLVEEELGILQRIIFESEGPMIEETDENYRLDGQAKRGINNIPQSCCSQCTII